MRRFSGLALRQMRARRLRALLTAGGIVLGVAMVFAVLLLTGTIRSTFEDFFASVYGRTDVVVIGRSGVGSLPVETLARVRAIEGVAEAQGVVTGVLRRVGADGRIVDDAAQLETTALDPAEPDQSGLRYVAGGPVRRRGEIVVDEQWARDEEVLPGQRLSLSSVAGRSGLRVAGVFRESAGGTAGGRSRARITLDDGRRLLGVPGGFSEIRIVAADDRGLAALERGLREALPTGVKVTTPLGRSDDASDQLQGLNVALLFFGGTALFVGGYLILNSFNMTVLQRTRELGTLRTLGASRAMVLRVVVLEALLLGVLGTALGLALGALVADAMLSALASGLDLPASDVHITAAPVVVAVVVGVLTSALGAVRPAWRAASVPPLRALTGGAAAMRRRPGIRRALLGVALFLPGLLFGGSFWFGESSDSALARALGLLSMLGLFVGLALLAPFMILPVTRVLSAPMRRLSPTSGRLAGDAVRGSPARTAATAAALMIGLSVVVVNGVMSASFVGSIREAIDRAYARDITVLPRDWTPVGAEQEIDPGLRARIAALPGAGVVAPVRNAYVELPGIAPEGTQNGILEGVDPALQPQVDLSTIDDANPRTAYAGLARGGALVDRAYANQAGVGVGDRIRLTGPAGTRAVRVAGILRLVAVGLPTVRVSLETFRETYGVTADTQLLVKADRPADRASLARAVAALLRSGHPGVEALSTAEVKDEYDRQISQQFAFFNSIVAVAVLISLLGVINTLSMSVLERRREIGVLRALGSSRGQVARTMLDESVLITLSGAVAGGAGGLLIGWTWVREARSLFPDMAFHMPAGMLIAVAVAGVVLGALAAVVPARHAARTRVLDAIAYE